LPHQFFKIRYFGFFATGQHPRLAALRQHLSASPVHPVVTLPEVDPPNLAISGLPPGNLGSRSTAPSRCPVCGGLLRVHPLPR
jgi:hypothetical protein